MLCSLFGWSKASKCKVLLKRVRCRLKLLRNKREAIVKQEREVIAQLLKNGHNPAATLSRAKQLFEDQSIVAAYDLLDQFCEFIVGNMPYIRKHKCANLPELQKLRKLFCRRYGSSFELAAVEACPGNHVNEQMREKLSLTTISVDAKVNLIQEIAQEFDVQHQVKDANLGYNYHVSDNDVCERDAQVVYSEIGHVGKMKSDSSANGVSQIEEQSQTRQVDASFLFDSSMDRFNQTRPPTEELGQGSSNITTNSVIDESKTPRDVRGVLKDFSNFGGKNQDPLAMKSESTSSSNITTNSAIDESKTPRDVRGVLKDFSNFGGKNQDPLAMKSESTSSSNITTNSAIDESKTPRDVRGVLKGFSNFGGKNQDPLTMKSESTSSFNITTNSAIDESKTPRDVRGVLKGFSNFGGKNQDPLTMKSESTSSFNITTNSAIDEGKTPKGVRGVLKDFSNFDGKNQDPLTMKSESTSSCSRKRRKSRRQRTRLRFASGHQHKFAAVMKREQILLTKFEECLQYYDGISDQSDIDSNNSHSKRKIKKPKIGNQSRLANGRRRTSSSKPPRRFSFGYEQGEKPNRRCKYVSRRSSLPGRMNMNTDRSIECPCYFLASDYEMDPNRSVFELDSQEDADITCGESKAGKNRGAPDPNPGSSPQRKLPTGWQAMLMPVERSEMEGTNKLGGYGSSSFRHIHPKLPDYDDVAAIFSALKEEHVKSSTAVH